MKPLRILMTISSFRPRVGGGEIQAERLAKGLAERGHCVTVLTRRFAPELPEEEDDGPFKVVRVGNGERWGSMGAMLRWVGSRPRDFDLVHAMQSNSPLVVATLAQGLWNIPSVCTPMTWRPELSWLHSGPVSALRRQLYRSTRLWIAKSNEIQTALESFASGRVVPIPNGVDTVRFVPGVPSRGAGLNVLYVGRLEPPKRLDLLLGAWGLVNQPTARLQIVGDGSLRPSLIELARSRSQSNVEFLGRSEDVLPLLQQADIFVLPSDMEGMPNAVLEAMSCALPCVASSVGAIPALLGGGAGVIVDEPTERCWAERLGGLCGNRSLRIELGHNARKRILERYSLDQIVGQVEQSYYRVVDDFKALPRVWSWSEHK